MGDDAQVKPFVGRATTKRCAGSGHGLGASNGGASIPDSAGGRLIRDKAGAPTGVVIDRAQALVTAKISPPTRAVCQRRLAAGLKACARAGLLTIRAIKVVADGALGSPGALLLAPYADEPGTKGLLTVDEGDLRRPLTRAAIPPAEMLAARVSMTIVGGRIVHDE